MANPFGDSHLGPEWIGSLKGVIDLAPFCGSWQDPSHGLFFVGRTMAGRASQSGRLRPKRHSDFFDKSLWCSVCGIYENYVIRKTPGSVDRKEDYRLFENVGDGMHGATFKE